MIFDFAITGISGKVGGVFCTKYQILMAEINFAVQIVIAIKPDTGIELGGGTCYQFILCRNILGEVHTLTTSIFEKNNNKKCRLELIVKYKFLCRCKSFSFVRKSILF